MNLQIKDGSLIDSPFEEFTGGDFIFDDNDINDFALDLIRGNPTCYLISGYRGVGKSSFINKVESKVINQKDSVNNFRGKFEHLLFVPTNFSRYKSQSFLLRKLIRALHLAIEDEKYLLVKKYLIDSSAKSDVLQVINALFDRTFHDVESSTSVTKEKVKGSEMNWDGNSLIILLFQLIGPILVTVAWSLNNKYNWLSVGELADWFVLGGAIGLSILNCIKFSGFRKKQKSEQEEFRRKTLYDDEIADHHYLNILHSLSALNVKVVFVIDELDKVEESEANQLMHEMKPYLVCGLASFIVVAGQKIYYRYFLSQAKDDDVIATLFSRTVHISLFSRDQLCELFRKLLVTPMEDAEFNKIRPYVDYLIFKSKRIPRRFVNLIRQNLIWDESAKGSTLRIDDKIDYSKYSRTLDLIDAIEATQITDRIESGIADFLTMKLFLDAEKKHSRSAVLEQLTK